MTPIPLPAHDLARPPATVRPATPRAVRLEARGRLRLLVRPVRPSDRHHLVFGMAHLSPESRYHRFFVPTRELSSQQLDCLCRPDGRDHIALIALVDGQTPADLPLPADVVDAQRVVAVVRAFRHSDRPTVAELSIVVGDPFQRRGVAPLLIRALAEVARTIGIDRFDAIVLGDNTPMLEVFRRLGGQVAFDSLQGVMTVELDLAEVQPVPRSGRAPRRPAHARGTAERP